MAANTSADIRSTRDVFLWCMSVVYLFAFTSLFVQIPGLNGDKGILPAKLVLEQEAESFHDLVVRQPTLLRLLPRIGFDVQTSMDFLCLGGAILAFVAMVSRDQRNCVVFAALWIFYLSIFQVGQAFLWFEWDVLLLEVGFLTILIAPLNFFGLYDASWHHAHDHITFWLVRWLLFRLVFASGVVKLTTSADGQPSSWWSLQAVGHHYETQNLPTPFAWYFHQLPDWIQKLSSAGILTIELAISLLILSPARHQRLLAFYSLVGLLSLMTLTGNYGFYALLLLTLCLSLVDDDWLYRWTGSALKGHYSTRRKENVYELGQWANPIRTGFSWISYGALVYGVTRLFGLHIQADPTRVEAAINFDEGDVEVFVRWAVVLTACLGAGSLVWQILSTVLGSYTNKRFRSSSKRITEVAGCVGFGLIALLFFTLSLVPHASVSKDLEPRVPQVLRDVQSWTTQQYQLTNDYQFSHRLTEDDSGRVEIILEGSNNLESAGWKEYNFRFKPGNVLDRLPIVSPHQPRLDWQMWFAARTDYTDNHWMLNLAFRLLTNQKEVLELMGNNPYPSKPPKYIRASLYSYQFTSNNSSDTERYSDKNWWVRQRIGDYLPVLSLDDESFMNYVEQAKLTDTQQQQQEESSDGDAAAEDERSTTARKVLGYIRSLFGQGNGSWVCLVLVVTGFLLTLLDPSIELFAVPMPLADGSGGPPAQFKNCLK